MLGMPLKIFAIPNYFYVTFMSNVSCPLYDDLNKTSDFWTKLSHSPTFDRKYEVDLADCILKNTYDILRKYHTYNIKARRSDWAVYVYAEERIKSLNSDITRMSQ